MSAGREVPRPVALVESFVECRMPNAEVSAGRLAIDPRQGLVQVPYLPPGRSYRIP